MQLAIPTGTVTFLFTDIEGSTALWESVPNEMRAALAQHDALLRRVIETHDGYVFKTVGDAFYAAFCDPADALEAAIDVQRSLAAEQWPETAKLNVRMSIHTGASQLRDNDYFGPTLNRVARLLSIARGGQIVLSQATQQLVQDRLPRESVLRDLGDFRLKDLQRPERAYQLVFDGMSDRSGPAVPSLAMQSTLPRELSSFIGRKEELAAVCALISAERVVTIVGPGGVGKTRLAVQAADAETGQFTGAIAFAELVEARNESEVLRVLAKALRVHARHVTHTSIAHALDRGRALLVLDNCEHVIDAARKIARKLLQECARLTVLATSREPLHLSGERIFDLAPLAVPPANASIDEIVKSDAVSLLLNRASLDDDFVRRNGNAPAIAQLCRRLDGIPLALELASSRIRSLSPQKIVERLDRRFALLTGGDRSGPSHHWTLERAVDWSYEQLSESERLLFSRVTIFESPFTLEAVERVCTDDAVPVDETLELLSALAEKSFVRYDKREARYRLLETLRAYARDRLSPNELPELRRRRAAYVREVVEREHRDPADNAAWLSDLEMMYGDVRAAMQYEIALEPANALHMAASLRLFWNIRGFYESGYALLRAAAEAAESEPDTAADRATVLTSAATLANAMGHRDEAVAAVEEARALFAALDHTLGLAQATNTLGMIHSSRGDLREAYTLFKTARDLYERSGDLGRSAMPLTNLGLLAVDFGDLNEADRYLHEAVTRADAAGDVRIIAWAEGGMGEVAAMRAACGRAKVHYERWIELSRSLGDKASLTAALSHLAELAIDEPQCGLDPVPLLRESLELAHDNDLLVQLSDTFKAFARFALMHRDVERCARMLAASDVLRERLEYDLRTAEQQRRDTLAVAGRALDESRFAAVYEKSRSVRADEAVRTGFELLAEAR